MSRVSNISISSLFFTGAHTEVVDRTIDSPAPTYSVDDFPYVVGALVMLGRIDEAKTAYALRRDQLSPVQKVICRFFLGMGMCRHSLYEKSKACFIENVRSRHDTCDATSRFFMFQGLGFYYYFAGRMKKSLRSASAAYEAALEGGYLYGRALAADLKGHALIQTGDIEHGLRTLEIAEHLASQLGAVWLKETIQASLLGYRARYGIQGENTVQDLLAKLKSLSQQDIYTQSALLLDLAQEYIRRGSLMDAKAALNESCRIIYASQNRRHAAILNLRYAYVHYLEGEPHLALNLVRNAITQINPVVDIGIELKLRGFERKLVHILRVEVCEKTLEEIVSRLTKKVGEIVALRILAREKNPNHVPVRYGEDPVGDLWDEIRRDKHNAIDICVKTGYLGLLAELLPVPRGSRALYLDLEPGSLTIFDQGNVEHYSGLLSRSLRAILIKIHKGPKTKEDLIEGIWKYKYHPMRHDALIYSTIAKLRKILGHRSHWVEVSDAGYQLRSEVSVVVQANEPPRSQSNGQELPTLPEILPEITLNHRQQKIIRYLNKHDLIDTSKCKAIFNTSEITASRDLSELHRLRLIERVGRGRATRYKMTVSETQLTSQTEGRYI